MTGDRHWTGFDFASPLGDYTAEITVRQREDGTVEVVDFSRQQQQEADRIYRHTWTASSPYRDREREEAVAYDPPDHPNCRSELVDPEISPDVFEGEFRVLETRRLDP